MARLALYLLLFLLSGVVSGDGALSTGEPRADQNLVFLDYDQTGASGELPDPDKDPQKGLSALDVFISQRAQSAPFDWVTADPLFARFSKSSPIRAPPPV